MLVDEDIGGLLERVELIVAQSVEAALISVLSKFAQRETLIRRFAAPSPRKRGERHSLWECRMPLAPPSGQTEGGPDPERSEGAGPGEGLVHPAQEFRCHSRI